MVDAQTAAGERASLLVAYGNFLFRYRDKIFPAVLIPLFFGFKPPLEIDGVPLEPWCDMIGLFVALMGQALRIAVIGYAYIKRGGLNKKVYAESLVTRGFFVHCRNPLYVGNLLVLAGLFVIHGNPWSLLIGGVFFVTAYIAIVAAEEKYLSSKFGEEYARYCRDVPRWTIRFKGLGATLGDMSFSWRRVISKEHSSAFTWIIAALIIVGIYEQPVYDNLVVLAIAAVVIAAFATVRVLRKSGRLVAP